MFLNIKTIKMSALSLAFFFSGQRAHCKANEESDLAIASRPGTGVTIGIRMGVVDVRAVNATTRTVGISTDFAVSKNVNLGTAMDYWSASSGMFRNTEVSLSDFALGMNGRFFFTATDAVVRPFGMLGLAAHKIGYQFARNNHVDSSNVIREFKDRFARASVEIGTDFGGGVMFRVQPQLGVVAEVNVRQFLDSTRNVDQLSYSGALAYIL